MKIFKSHIQISPSRKWNWNHSKMTGHTTDIEGEGRLEVGVWDQRQRGMGRHFSTAKQLYIFFINYISSFEISCVYIAHLGHLTCSQLHPLSTSSLPSSVPILPILLPTFRFFCFACVPLGWSGMSVWFWGWNYLLESGEYTSENMMEGSGSPSPRVNQ